MNDKGIIAHSIVQFLREELRDGALEEDRAESLEVAVQCIESAFNIENAQNVSSVPNLRSLFERSLGRCPPEAEDLKNKGNMLMLENKPQEALQHYNIAIELYDKNAVFFCNRAAAHSKLGNHMAAVEDCKKAIALNPTYGKAYGRLGLAYTSLKKHSEARDAYKRAAELEPENVSYKSNLQVCEDAIAQGGESVTAEPRFTSQSIPEAIQNLNVNQLLGNSGIMNLVSQVLTNPEIQNSLQGLRDAPADLSYLVNAGQQLAQEMETRNPELLAEVRRMFGEQSPPQPPSQ